LQILERSVELHFELRRQQLIELIKANRIGEALEFAQQNLASSLSRNPQDPSTLHFQAELEKTMTLIMYEDVAKSPPALQELVDTGARSKLASRVNQAILKE